MKVDRDLIKSYLDYITMVEPENQKDPLADMETFDQAIDDMANIARAKDDLDLLRISMDALIAAPDDRIDQFEGPLYPYSEAELVSLFTYAYERIWPDEFLSDPGDELDIEFTPASELAQPSD